MTSPTLSSVRTVWAIVILVGMEIALIAVLTAVGVRGTPAVVIVVAFALLERVVYARWIKRRPGR